MGQRGPAPTPTEILRARGSWRADANPDEPQPEQGAPECPPGMSEAAQKVWQSVVSLIAAGVLTKDGVQTLARYCHGVVRWWKLAAWLEENEDTYEVKDACLNTRHVRHPNVVTYATLGKDLLRMEQEFGLTPAARTRVAAVKTEKPKPKPSEAGPVLKIAR